MALAFSVCDEIALPLGAWTRFLPQLVRIQTLAGGTALDFLVSRHLPANSRTACCPLMQRSCQLSSLSWLDPYLSTGLLTPRPPPFSGSQAAAAPALPPMHHDEAALQEGLLAAASVWSRDGRRGQRVLSKLECAWGLGRNVRLTETLGLFRRGLRARCVCVCV